MLISLNPVDRSVCIRSPFLSGEFLLHTYHFDPDVDPSNDFDHVVEGHFFRRPCPSPDLDLGLGLGPGPLDGPHVDRVLAPGLDHGHDPSRALDD